MLVVGNAGMAGARSPAGQRAGPDQPQRPLHGIIVNTARRAGRSPPAPDDEPGSLRRPKRSRDRAPPVARGTRSRRSSRSTD